MHLERMASTIPTTCKKMHRSEFVDYAIAANLCPDPHDAKMHVSHLAHLAFLVVLRTTRACGLVACYPCADGALHLFHSLFAMLTVNKGMAPTKYITTNKLSKFIKALQATYYSQTVSWLPLGIIACPGWLTASAQGGEGWRQGVGRSCCVYRPAASQRPQARVATSSSPTIASSSR